MLNELCLYAELLLFLAGTFLYAFLTRELLRRRQVLVGNWPLRALLLALTLWYACLLLHQVFILLLEWPLPRTDKTLDLVRGFAWVVTFPLMAHTLGRFLFDDGKAIVRGLSRSLVMLSYLSAMVFVPSVLDFARTHGAELANAVQPLFPWVIAHSTGTLLVALWLTALLIRRAPGRRLVGFLRFLVAIQVILVLGLLASGFFRPWEVGATGVHRVVRTLVLGGLLLPGGLFAVYVHRFNLLRLSIPHRTLRHFLAVLMLVALVMLAGPTLAPDNLDLFRRFVAWGLLLALALGSIYQPLVDRALERSAWLRRLLGKHVEPPRLDRLMASIQGADLSEGEAMERAASELGTWLGARVELLPSPSKDLAFAPFFEAFDQAETLDRLDRLAPPNRRLALLLDRHGLHAVFPLRVEAELRGVLGLWPSAMAGGYGREELQAVRLVMRQLEAELTLRRRVEVKVEEERRLAESERLRMLGLVSASLAHEVKNPLSSMKALAQALREDLAATDPRSEGVADLDVIVEQVDRLHETTGEILALARPRPGDTTDLSALLESSLYVLRAEARRLGVELEGREEGKLDSAHGSAATWQTILFNLVLNAIEHSPSGATVDVSLRATDERIVLVVGNVGEPVPRPVADGLFELFVSERAGGTGLGLPLAARRARSLGGVIAVGHERGRVVFSVEVPNADDEEEDSR